MREMAKKILQINMKYKIPADVLAKAFMDLAKPISEVKGLEWKVWLHDPVKKTAGGIYLFKDEKSVNDYLNGKIVADIMKNPAVSDIDAKVFDVLPEHSKVTRAPI
jgi:hypothetical protein